MFESCFVTLLDHKVRAIIEEQLDACLVAEPPTTLTKATLQAAKEATHAKLWDLEGFELIISARKVDIYYGRALIASVPIKSVAEEVDLSFSAAVKRLSVTQGGLKKKPSFEDLVVADSQRECKHNAIVPAEVVARAATMRARLNTLISDATAATADSMMQVVVEKVAYPK